MVPFFKGINYSEFLGLAQDRLEFLFLLLSWGMLLGLKKIWPFGKVRELEKKKTWMLILNVAIACFRASSLVSSDLMEYLFGALVIAITLIIYGIVFIVVEWFRNRNSSEERVYLELIDIGRALIIGLISTVPGTREVANDCCGLLIGFSRSSAEFSFILSIPMIVGASGYKLIKFSANDGFNTIPNGLGFIIVLVIGILFSFNFHHQNIYEFYQIKNICRLWLLIALG